MKNILVFDVGTTSMKCILYNEIFKELFATTIEYSIETKDGIIAQIDANVYFDTFKDCVQSVLNSGINKEDISAISFTTQGETLIPVDKFGNPLCKAIVWLDTRAEKEAEYIKQSISSEEIYKTTGLCDIDGAVPIAKLLYICRNNPAIYGRVHKFLLLEDYLIFRLTGLFISEKSLQSSTGWYNITGERLFDKVFEICNIDKEKIPHILPCGTDVGTVTDEAAKTIGLSKNTHVITAAMDQISSAIGAGNITEGIVTETTGTALVVGVTVKKPDFDISKPVTVYKHYNNMFIYMPYFPTAGIVHKWFRNTVFPDVNQKAESLGISPYSLIEEEAKHSPAGSNGVVFNPDFTSGGSFSGLNLSTTRADLARSVQEGIAYVLRELLEQVESKGVNIAKVYSLGGGSYSKLWTQIKASVCDKDFTTVGYSETTSLGCAILASVAIGMYADVEDALSVIDNVSKTFNSICSEKKVYDKCFQNYKKLK